MRRAEMRVTGCDYGATSFTTRDQAGQLVELLALRSGDLLLDIGSGAGWPGIHLSRSTGCRVVLTDPSLDGLRVAHRRISAENVVGVVVASSGETLPFQDEAFDAVTHSDVLCCLQEKQLLLKASRRVLKAGGRLSFMVIELAEGLSSAFTSEAVAVSPDYVEADGPYRALMENAGFEKIEGMDVTDTYRETLSAWIREWDNESSELVPLLGTAEFDERQTRRRRALSAVDEGWIRRTLFTAYRGENS